MRGRAIHLLSCARMFYDWNAAVELARQYHIDVESIQTSTSYVFIVDKKSEFTDLWMDKRQGHYFMRGDCETPKCDMLYKSYG